MKSESKFPVRRPRRIAQLVNLGAEYCPTFHPELDLGSTERLQRQSALGALPGLASVLVAMQFPISDLQCQLLQYGSRFVVAADDRDGSRYYVHTSEEGAIHRTNGPAVIRTSPSESDRVLCRTWALSGKRHRIDNPAVISFGPKYEAALDWFVNDAQHRDRGPAHITYYGGVESVGELVVERWFAHGKLHRSAGPADVHYFGRAAILKVWHLRGSQCPPLVEIEMAVSRRPDKLVSAFLTVMRKSNEPARRALLGEYGQLLPASLVAALDVGETFR